ncbi:MAG: Uma2 family endonuclease [Pyrinomonadaceae bacterium]
MSTARRTQSLASPDEYLASERAAFERHECLDGLIYAIAGESPEHSIINANLTIAIGGQLRGKPCTVFSPNMKVYSRLPTDRGLKGLFSYPDVLVVCGQPLYYDEHRDVVVNPTVVIEVLSKSTESYDRGNKFIRYRQNASLTDYLLVSQSHPYVEHFTRRDGGHWEYTFALGLEGSLYVASIDSRLQLAEVYDRIDFPDDATEDEPDSEAPPVVG